MKAPDSSPKPAPKKGGRQPKLDPELVAATLAKNHGNISATAKRFNVHRKSVQELIDKKPALQQVLSDARESMLDGVESALYRAALKGEAWAVCFYLKTQGKGRGYIERQEFITNRAEFGDELRRRLAEVDLRDHAEKPGASSGAGVPELDHTETPSGSQSATGAAG